ncbi:MAG: hypothetical protein RMJ44_04460 [Cytophagales bacterium]|nr:hypothetical protein [Bernardetiaceae bacterium]MDW8210317.1 hypothetical protein [Cytophagales bacterium]
MMVKVLVAMAWLWGLLAQNDIGDIAAINRLKREAEIAFHNKFWNTAIDKYRTLIDRYQVKEPAVFLNLAHAYFQIADYEMALQYYEQAARIEDRQIQTIAFQQAAIIKAQKGEMEEALKYLRRSLRAAPTNQAARHNYEVVYALWLKQKQQGGQSQTHQEQSSQNQNRQQQQQNATRQEQNSNSGSGEENQQDNSQGEESQPSNTQLRSRRLEKINMTEEQAKNILEAIRNNEVQYLQQLQRRITRPPDRTKPDW